MNDNKTFYTVVDGTLIGIFTDQEKAEEAWGDYCSYINDSGLEKRYAVPIDKNLYQKKINEAEKEQLCRQ